MKRCVLAFFAVLLFVSVSSGAVSFQSAATGSGGAVSVVSLPDYTIASPCVDPVLVVCVSQAFEDDLITAVTYNGVALTERANGVSGGNHARGDVWRLVNPLVGSAADIVVTMSDATNGAVVSAYALCGVDQTTPLGTTVTATGPDLTSVSASVTVPPNGMALSCLCQADPLAESLVTASPADVGQTERAEHMRGTQVLGAGGTRTTTGACGWTWDGGSEPTVLHCLPINPAVAVGGSASGRRRF